METAEEMYSTLHGARAQKNMKDEDIQYVDQK